MRIREIGVIGALVILAAYSGGQTPPSQLTIEEAVRFGLRHSPSLRVSQAEISAARAETGIARARTQPQLSVNGFVSQGNMPNMLRSVGVEPQAMLMAPDGGFFDANLMLMAPLYTGGYLQGLVAAAIAREHAAIAEASAMRAEVTLRIRESYARALYGVELAKAQQSRVEAAVAMVQIAQAQVDVGMGIEASVRRAEAELAEARRELTIAENDRGKMLLELLAEMGASMDIPVTLMDSLVFTPPARTLKESIVAADQTRGELLAARQRVRAAGGQVSSAEGALRPQVYGFAMGDAFTSRDVMGRNMGYTVGVAVSLPLLDGGMRRSEVAAARSMRERAQAEADRWRLQVEKEVRQAWLDIETAAQNYRTAEAALAAAQVAYEVIVLRVEAGKGILVEQLDALAALTRARAFVAQALYEHQIAVDRLGRAIGETGTESTGDTRK